MSLFNFGKKKENCNCNKSSNYDKSKVYRFIVLGACCKKSKDTFENAKLAVKEMGFDDEVINIGDNVEIAKYGVMQTPALVVNSKVVSYGKLLTVDEIKKLIEKSEVK